MKKLNRELLSAPAKAFLDARTQQVLACADPKEEAQRLWKQQDNQSFDEVRTKLRSMATGLERCMYCEDSAATDIEHFWPKSKYPERAFSWSNYLLACSCCNSNHKREQFPLDEAGAPLLIDPTTEDPRERHQTRLQSGADNPRVPLRQCPRVVHRHCGGPIREAVHRRTLPRNPGQVPRHQKLDLICLPRLAPQRRHA